MEIKGLKQLKMTQEHYNDSHSIYMKLYAILVYDLLRDPVEAIQVLAIWIWMERMTMVVPALTRRILTLSSHLIDNVVNEALFCLTCVNDVGLLYTSSVAHFPLMKILLKKEIPIKFFREHREITIAGINEVIDCVCSTCLKDKWNGAIARIAHMELSQNVANHVAVIAPQKAEIQPDERALFVTFSRGYPVAEWEVREFLTRLFGECIESFCMQEVAAGEHALFAKIVLHHASYIHVVLRGGTKAKFSINGKQVWMRKFIPKRR